MRQICFIFARWYCIVFFLCSSAALAQTPTYPFISAGSSVGLYSYYGIFPNILTPTGSNNFAFTYYNLTKDNEGEFSSSQKIQAFRAALARYGFPVADLSDYGAGVDGSIYEMNMKNFSAVNSSSVPRAYFFRTSGFCVYRLTPFPNTYDCFVYWIMSNTGRISSNNRNLAMGVLSLNESTSELSSSTIPDGAILSTGGLYTYDLACVFRAQITDSAFSIVSAYDQWGLPFDVGQDGGHILYCVGRPNSYWNTPLHTYTATDYINMSQLPTSTSQNLFLLNFTNSDNFPRYRVPYFEFPSRQGSDIFSNAYILEDTDSGGMLDFQEWFQTNHDLLDPSDDDDNTETLPPADPPEGEYVVDIGKDTVQRYDSYWQQGIGDDSNLPDVDPPDIDDLDPETMEDVNLESLYQGVKGAFDDSIEETEFKSTFDSVFSPLGPSDQELTWTFNPSINNSFVNLQLSPVTIDPQSVVNNPHYSSYFSIIRGCLVLVEFLVFCYSLYRITMTSISGTSGGGSEE